MRKLYVLTQIILIFVFSVYAGNFYAQCNNTSLYPSSGINAPTIGITTQISNCNWASEYAHIQNVAAAANYSITSSISTDFITVRQGSSGGALIAYGVTPLNWTSTNSGNYYVHFNSNASCETETACRNTHITGLLPSGPMTYLSTSVTQVSTAGVPTCGTNQGIIRIEVVTTGITSPLDLTKFVIQTDGSTSPAILNNISNIDIFYTGSNPNFSASSLFASAPPQVAGGDINFSGSQTLVYGSNYFWVTYDMNGSSATIGDVIDARLKQLMVGPSSYSSPADYNGAPTGNRTIIGCQSSPAGVADNNTFWISGADGVTQSGSYVSSWTSSAPGSVAVSQSTSSKRPTYQNSSAGFNYNPHIKFDGIDDEILNATPGDILGDTGTVIVVSTTQTSGQASEETIFAYNDWYKPNYQIKPKYNCGLGPVPGSNKWQLSWSSILTSVSTPDTRPQILGLQSSATAYGFRNGLYGTNPSTTSSGATVAMQLTLGSRGDYENQNREYSPASLAEVILYNRQLSESELNRIQSYLAIKYGITMGTNGTSTDYFAADGSVIWDVSENNGYNYDIAGIGRDDIGGLDQRKSHSINGTSTTYSDIVTISKGNNFDYPTNFSNNESYFVWGRNNDIPEGDYLIDVQAPIATRFRRVWKGQEKGNVGIVTLEFDMSTVPGPSLPGTNDLNEVRLLVDADGEFAGGASAISASYVDNVNNIVRFQHQFSAATGYYFTIGSVNMAIAPLPVSLSEFTAACKNGKVDLNWTTQSESNNAFFGIEKSTDARIFNEVARVSGHGNSSSLINYSWTDDSRQQGVAYYRLKQTDFDGAFEYHDVVSVDCSTDYPFRIYPNPTSDGVFIENFNPSKSKLKIEVVNVLGATIDRREISESAWIKLPATNGIYFIKVVDGENLFVEKIVKK